MVFELDDISLKQGEKWVLKNLCWKVNKGEHWALLGLNGAGKTSILHLLNAYSFPTKGRMNVLGLEFGKTYLAERLRKQIGYVSSSLQQKFHSGDNAFEVVLSGAFASIGLHDSPTDDMRKKAIRLLEKLGCMEYANLEYAALSQGEKQRVLIARALMADPKLLILDEPTSGLDFIAREQLLDSIEELAKLPNAPTMIYVTHHVEEILPIFNKTLLLKEGQVFASGDTNILITSDLLSEFFGIPVNVIWNHNRPLLTKAKIALK